jgi:hypothetical protein
MFRVEPHAHYLVGAPSPHCPDQEELARPTNVSHLTSTAGCKSAKNFRTWSDLR